MSEEVIRVVRGEEEEVREGREGLWVAGLAARSARAELARGRKERGTYRPMEAYTLASCAQPSASLYTVSRYSTSMSTPVDLERPAAEVEEGDLPLVEARAVEVEVGEVR